MGGGKIDDHSKMEERFDAMKKEGKESAEERKKEEKAEAPILTPRRLRKVLF